MIQIPARSISDVPSDGSWIHESVHPIRLPTRVHDFPFLTVMTSQCLPKARRMFDFVSSWVTRLRVCSFATSGSGITPVSRRMSKVIVTWRRAQEGRHLLIDKVAFKVADHSSAARLYRRPCEDRQRTYLPARVPEHPRHQALSTSSETKTSPDRCSLRRQAPRLALGRNMIVPSPRKGENRPTGRAEMSWCPGSNVAGLDTLKFLHVACGLESRMCQGRVQSNLT